MRQSKNAWCNNARNAFIPRWHEVVLRCRACWDPFVDPVTSIVGYSVTAHQYPGNVTPLVPPLNVGLQRSAQIVNLTLTVSPCCHLRP